MSITISQVFPGHWETTQTTTTTVTFVGNVGYGTADTYSTDKFRHGPNKWGQVGVEIDFYNESDKEIKYIEFEVVPFNSVRDRAGANCILKATGPFRPGSMSKQIWGFVWTSSSIRSLSILDCKVEYMDGTVEHVTKSANLLKKYANDKTYKKLNYDGSVGITPTWPTILSVLLVLSAVSTLFIYRNRLMSRDVSFIPIPWISFALIVVLVYIAYFLTQKKRNKTGTIIVSIAAVICAIVNFTPRFGISQYLTKINMYLNPLDYYSFMHLISYIGTLIMLIMLVISALNIIKKYSKRKEILGIVYWTMNIMIVGAWILCFVKEINKQGYHTIGNWPEGYIMIVVDIALWSLIWLVSKACRYNYNIDL